MKIFAIADLHLSGNPPMKPMEIFGDNWINHWEKIKKEWSHIVSPEDVVLLAGDTSWALKLDDALVDLNEIIVLPGKKIIVKGNHDYWWQSQKKMTTAVAGELSFLQNNFYIADHFAICGSRGWICPDDPCFTTEDQAIYSREVLRVKNSLTAAKQAGFQDIILMLHYPPIHTKENGFTALLEEFNVNFCIYGHLHGEAAQYGPSGYLNDTTCYLVACDALDFKLKRIM